MDHGHPLRLGLSLRAGALDAGQVAELARISEDEGLDLLAVADGGATDDDSTGDGTAGDGPTGGLDAWTTLGWLAGTTARIALTTENLLVTGPPTVLARATTGLDHLTGGRVAVGLGATAGPGGPGTAALAEAVDILRGMWAGGQRELVARGPHHPVPGAAPGPVPAHDVPIWLTGSSPALVGLAARSADGWWLRHDGPGTADVLLAQDAFDTAARAVDRDPGEVRRAVTFTRLPTPAELGALVLDSGVDTILLATGDLDELRRFARVVAPEVRATVAAERSRRGTRRPARPARVRAARRAGIDYDTTPAGIEVVEPGDLRYATLHSTYLRGGRPGLVLLPRDTAEVAAALVWAQTQPVDLAIRSGGHGISGRSTNDGGLVLDLRKLDEVTVVDESTRRVRIGPGARWGEVAEVLEPHGWALTSGDYGGVGVGGLATAGGLGFLAREHGLTIDHLRAAEVVLADGSVVRADETQHADLFWGLRGAGGNLGVVTAFEFEVDVVGLVGFAQLAFSVDDLARYLEEFGALVEASPRDLTPSLILGRPRGGEVVAQVLAVVDSAEPEVILDRLQPFARLAPLVQQSVRLMPYTGVVQRTENVHDGRGEPVTRSAALTHLTPGFARDAEALVRSGEVHFFQIRSAGGAVNDVPAGATAYAHREANFNVVAFGGDRDGLDRRWDAMSHHFSGIYSSFETDRRPERVAEVFPSATLARLRDLKRTYDPTNVFRHNFSVADDDA